MLVVWGYARLEQTCRSKALRREKRLRLVSCMKEESASHQDGDIMFTGTYLESEVLSFPHW